MSNEEINLDWMNSPEKALEDTSEGWGSVDNENVAKANQEQSADALISVYKVNKLIFDVLENSPRGPELMAHLRRMTVDQPSFVFSTQTVIGQNQLAVLTPEQQGMMREGQNSIYRWFVDSIAAARKGPPQSSTVKENQNG